MARQGDANRQEFFAAPGHNLSQWTSQEYQLSAGHDLGYSQAQRLRSVSAPDPSFDLHSATISADQVSPFRHASTNQANAFRHTPETQVNTVQQNPTNQEYQYNPHVPPSAYHNPERHDVLRAAQQHIPIIFPPTDEPSIIDSNARFQQHVRQNDGHPSTHLASFHPQPDDFSTPQAYNDHSMTDLHGSSMHTFQNDLGISMSPSHERPGAIVLQHFDEYAAGRSTAEPGSRQQPTIWSQGMQQEESDQYTYGIRDFQPMNEDTVALCSLWQHANPGKTPKDLEISFLGSICDDSTHNIQIAFEDINQGLGKVPGQYQNRKPLMQNSPDRLTLAAYAIWKRNHPKDPLTEFVSTALSFLFQAPLQMVRNWGRRLRENGQIGREIGQRTDDSAIFMTAGHTPYSVSEIPSCPSSMRSTSCNLQSDWITHPASRFECQKVTKDIPEKFIRHYICLNCGHTFFDAATWKRHEANFYRPEEFSCSISPPGRVEACNKMWSRKEEGLSHMKAHHSTEPLSLQWTINPKNHMTECYFRQCTKDQPFKSWDQSMKHIAQCLKEKDWKYQDFRQADTISNIEGGLPGGGAGTGGDGSGGFGNVDGPDADPGFGDGGESWSPSPNQPPPLLDPSYQGSSNSYGSNNRSCHSLSSPLMIDITPAAADSSHRLEVTKLATATSFRSTSLWSSELSYVGHLGTGGRSVIYEVRIRGEMCTLALKALQTQLPESKRELTREITCLAKIKQHPHVIKLIDSYCNLSAILFAPVADCDLSTYLYTYGATFHERRDLWLWFSCLTSGLQHIHEQGVTHRDIKPSNILVKDRNVLFADFGSSSTIDEPRCEKRAIVYTKLYAAPEVADGHSGTEADIFSLGCVFLEMVTMLISKDMLKDLQALQARSYHQQVPASHWARDWNQHLSKSVELRHAERHIHNILLACGQMISYKPEDRPSAATLDRQLNPQLFRHCDFRGSFKLPQDHVMSITKRNSVRGKTIIATKLAALTSKEEPPNKESTDLRIAEKFVGTTQAKSCNSQYRIKSISDKEAVEAVSVYLGKLNPLEIFRSHRQTTVTKLAMCSNEKFARMRTAKSKASSITRRLTSVTTREPYETAANNLQPSRLAPDSPSRYLAFRNFAKHSMYN